MTSRFWWWCVFWETILCSTFTSLFKTLANWVSYLREILFYWECFCNESLPLTLHIGLAYFLLDFINCCGLLQWLTCWVLLYFPVFDVLIIWYGYLFFEFWFRMTTHIWCRWFGYVEWFNGDGHCLIIINN